jgi:hypothetical protein
MLADEGQLVLGCTDDLFQCIHKQPQTTDISVVADAPAQIMGRMFGLQAASDIS